ncbi:hypothetical protein [Streptomyces sp. NPDC001781]
MNITSEHIATAAENIGLYEDDYAVRSAYKGWNLTPCAGVTLPADRMTAFLVSLAVVLAEQGRAEDALKLAAKTDTETLGLDFTVYWPGVQLAA